MGFVLISLESSTQSFMLAWFARLKSASEPMLWGTSATVEMNGFPELLV